MPIGNLTSQIFANIFLDKLDWFIKKQLRIKYYFRYADDFVIVNPNPDYLREIIHPIEKFLNTKLDLELHPQKIEVRKFRQGIDFLGYVILPHYITLRTKTKGRIFKRIGQKIQEWKQGEISEQSFNQTIQSYLGLLKHCNSYKIKKKLETEINNKIKGEFVVIVENK